MARSTSSNAGRVTLYSPSGEHYSTADPAEITRLKSAHGYTTKRPSQKSTKKATPSSPKRSSKPAPAEPTGSSPADTPTP